MRKYFGMNLLIMIRPIFMKAKKVFENIEFRRGLDPKESLQIGINTKEGTRQYLEKLKIMEVNLNNYARGSYKDLLGKKITSLIIQALKEIGKDNVTEEQLKKIKNHLKLEKEEIIDHDAKLAPAWIAKIMKNN